MDSQKPLGNLSSALIKEPTDDTIDVRLRAGDLCPKCNLFKLDYDGLLNLSCPQCGSVAGGCFT